MQPQRERTVASVSGVATVSENGATGSKMKRTNSSEILLSSVAKVIFFKLKFILFFLFFLNYTKLFIYV
ncbi:hypothetical protein HN51_056536 [Arachis hypogaea]